MEEHPMHVSKGLIWIFVIVAVSIQCGPLPSLKDESTIKFGATLPLTGTAAVWGKNARNGMELARQEINAAGGVKGRKIEIIYEDTTGLPQVGVSAIQKLITVDKVPVVMGCITSSTTLAMAPVAAKNQVVLFSPGASNPKLSASGPYFFRNFPSDAIEAPQIAKMVWTKLGLKKVAILLVNNEFGKGHEAGFKSEYERLGGTIVASESFEQEATDFRTQITKIKGAHPDGIFVPGYPKEMSTILRQLQEARLSVPVICPSALIDDELLKVAGPAANGVIFADQRPADPNAEVVRHFREAYKKAYGEEPGIVCDTAYDAVRILAKCIGQGGDTGPAIRDQLARVKDFPGAAGSTTFDAHGDITKTPIFKKVEGRKIMDFWDNPPSP
jgi:branched-chain amino acid transport system substrate-binding protein